MGRDMKDLTSKQRVALALSHREGDRVPFSLGGTAQKLHNRITLELLEHFKIKEKPQTVLAGYTYSLYSIPLMKELGTDIAYLFMDAPRRFRKDYQNGTRFVDEWGLTRNRTHGFINFENSPLQYADVCEVEKYQGPDPNDPDRVTGLRETARVLMQETSMADIPRSWKPRSVDTQMFARC